MPMNIHDIFVSYSRADLDRVTLLVQALKAAGYTVWWDNDLQTGQRFRPAIQQALDTAGCVVVVWSQHSVHSEWVPLEAQQALNRHALIPVRLEPVEIPMPFGGVQTLDLQGWQGDRQDERFNRLSQDIQATLNNPTPPDIRDDTDVPPEPPTPPTPPDQNPLWWQSLGMTSWKWLGVVFTLAGGITACVQIYQWAWPETTPIVQEAPAWLQLSYTPKGAVQVGRPINLLYQAKPEGFLSLWLQNPDDTAERLLPNKAGKKALALTPDIASKQLRNLTPKDSGKHRFLLIWTPQDQALVEYYPSHAQLTAALGALPNKQQTELEIQVVP